MSSEDHIQSIKDLYSCFERGDIDAVLSKLADDVDWDHNTAVNHNVAYYVTCKGRLAVKEKFFGAIAEGVDLTQFDRHERTGSDSARPNGHRGLIERLFADSTVL